MVRRRVPLVTLMLVAVGLVAGGLWWWAVLRLLLVPGEAGPVEGAVAAGGWGLSLLPVHVAASSRRRAASSGTGGGGAGSRGSARAVTRASRRRRWGAGSGPS
ncbi:MULTISPECIES: hypothetical protein [unclassified Streptomyces]|uniref:hypothetical protein n=1 Tax=unclassified Streptomyces TaxID=2593676 RepID=UPI002E34D74C|nr:hypothetical protein [Streptomyces sp. NBC_01268]